MHAGMITFLTPSLQNKMTHREVDVFLFCASF